MRRTPIALIGIASAAAAPAVAGAVLPLIGIPAALLAGCAVGLAGGGIALRLAHRADRAERTRLATLAAAVGLEPGETATPEALVANLCRRLERAAGFKQALAGLKRPVVVLDAEQRVIAVSAGMSRLRPAATEDAALQDLALETTGDGAVVVDSRRFLVHETELPGGRRCLELRPEGVYLAADDLGDFAAALEAGRTQFRFDDWSMAHDPARRALGTAMARLDAAVQPLVTHVPEMAREGLAHQSEALLDLILALTEERDAAVAARMQLDAKMQAILLAIDRYRASVTALAELADESREGLRRAESAITRGRAGAQTANEIELTALQLVGEAAQTAVEGEAEAGDVLETTRQIETLLERIEDVGFRTNLLALNAAIEAARAGTHGASFAVVAQEVRMLAQSNQSAAREIRQAVTAARQQAGNSARATATIKNTIVTLNVHLENLSDETAKIADALEEGSGAIDRLDGSVNAVGSEAARALQLPKRRAVGDAGIGNGFGRDRAQ